MGNDHVKYALWIGGFSLAITLGCGLYIAWTNGGSRNLALGLGALAGACVILILQIVFELKGTTTSADFVVEFVVDYQQKEVSSARAFNQSLAVATGYQNMVIEIEASKAIVAAKPALSRDEAPKITRDLGIVSIISYLLDEQSDWQLDTRSYRTSLGTMTQWVRVSSSSECSLITVGAIREKAPSCWQHVRGHSDRTEERRSIALPPTACSVGRNTELSSDSKLCMQHYFYASRTVCEHDVNRPSRGGDSKSN